MNWIYVLMAVPSGFLLGILFFGGLWWTVQWITAGSKPAPLLIASFLVRSAILLTGFYLLLTVGWQYLVAALAGFLAARLVLTYKYKPGKEGERDSPGPEHE